MLSCRIRLRRSAPVTAESPHDTVDPVKTWIIGRGGLLGRALARRFTDQWTAPAITWSNPTAALAALRTQAKQFHEQTADQPWALLWAAGAGVVSSDAAALQAERSYLMTVLESVAARRNNGRGVVFLASSAGGVYAGSAPAPFHAGSPAVARSPYGEVKLQQESDARRLLADRAGLLIGRIANLYGPDQNPDKQQGLITRLCQAAAHRSPLNLYVPLGTLRDYVYADDAAAVIAQQVRRSLASHQRPYEQTVMVVATGQATSVGQLIGVVQGVTHRRVPLATGSQAGTRIAAQRQVPDLRLIPTVPLSERTALATGVRRVFDALVTRTRTA
jgi:UDP-glucose 4-epimerase